MYREEALRILAEFFLSQWEDRPEEVRDWMVINGYEVKDVNTFAVDIAKPGRRH